MKVQKLLEASVQQARANATMSTPRGPGRRKPATATSSDGGSPPPRSVEVMIKNIKIFF